MKRAGSNTPKTQIRYKSNPTTKATPNRSGLFKPGPLSSMDSPTCLPIKRARVLQQFNLHTSCLR